MASSPHPESGASHATESDQLAYPTDPELIVGLVAPIGTPIPYFTRQLTESLKLRGYEVLEHKLSKFAEKTLLPGGTEGMSAFVRYRTLMNLGNKLRGLSGRDDVLALFASSAINATRNKEGPAYFRSTVLVFDQLKRPEEVYRLRKIYGEHFLLIGLFCPKDIRIRHLEQKGMSAEEARELVESDEDDRIKHGQRVSDTFHLADVFIEVRGSVESQSEQATILGSLERFWSLVFGDDIVTPTREEYGMYLAYAAGLRSSSLARQVGAAILTTDSELVAVGANDIPSFPGGLYWGDEVSSSGESRDQRDHIIGGDESDRMKRVMIGEVLAVLTPDWTGLDELAKSARIDDALTRFKGSHIASLTEFARAVHAEMEAISSAARVGISIRGATLYTTTFPCHNCAKHIVACGISKVVFIEPYSKSRALAMYGDSIYVTGESPPSGADQKVHFAPFVGVAPRRYQDLFGRYNYEGRRIEYKDKDTGKFKPEVLSLRIAFSPHSYVVREQFAARDLSNLRDRIDGHAAIQRPE